MTFVMAVFRLCILEMSLRLSASSCSTPLRGHGMSELPIDVRALKNWYIFRDDVVEFFERYIDSPVVLAGHSYGAVTGILAMPKIKDKVSGYVGFDPVILPAFARLSSRLPGGRAYMKKRLPIARNAARRKSHFESFDAAFARYQNRGAFRGFTDEALQDYLTGGLIPDGDSVKLACDPLWEQRPYLSPKGTMYLRARRTCRVIILTSPLLVNMGR